jgi:hypothetical protein
MKQQQQQTYSKCIALQRASDRFCTRGREKEEEEEGPMNSGFIRAVSRNLNVVTERFFVQFNSNIWREK